MKLSSTFLWFIGTIAMALAFTMPARAVVPERWCDCITVNGNGVYVVTPGNWTLNGVVIGQTWIGGGEIQGPAPRSCSYVNLPCRPNDFHYDGDTYTQGGTVTTISCWVYWIEIPMSPEINLPLLVSNSGSANLMMTTDYRPNANNPTVTIMRNNVQIFNGPASTLNPSALGLATIGLRELDFLSAIPTVSEWGLIVISILLLSAGTVFVRRLQPTLAIAGTNVRTSTNVRIFSGPIFVRALAVTLAIGLVAVVSVVLIKGHIGMTDGVGTFTTAVALAYLIHLWLMPQSTE